MQIRVTIAVLSCICALSPVHPQTQDHKSHPERWLIENVGQIHDDRGLFREDVLAVATAGNTQIYVRRTGWSYVFSRDVIDHADDEHTHRDCSARTHVAPLRTYRMDVDFIAANAGLHARFQDQAGFVSVYQGSERYVARQWGELVLENVYPHIDFLIRLESHGLKYDFILRPGARPEDVRLRYMGADSMLLDGGDIQIATPLARLVEHAPVAFTELSEQKTIPVACRYELSGNDLSFHLAESSFDKPLIIDPFVEWASYIGGTGDDFGNNVTFDGAGNVIVAGWTRSMDFPSSPGVVQTTTSGLTDIYVSKFSAAGSRLWTTYYGGAGNEGALGVHANSAGIIAVTGYTNSPDFPVSSGSFQSVLKGDADGFLFLMNPDGTVRWSTYFGGSLLDEGHSVVLDNAGNVVVTGRTVSTDFPIDFGSFQMINRGGQDAFIIKFNDMGGKSWATFYGGGQEDWGHAVAVDPTDNIVVSGHTLSADFPVTPDAFQGAYRGIRDGFVLKLSPSGTRIYASYIGGNDWDDAYGVAVDEGGNIIATGGTESLDFPSSPGAFQGGRSGNVAAFAFKMNPSGQRVWATYYAGSKKDIANAAAVYPSGNLVITGHTNSSDLILTSDAAQPVNRGGTDAFLAKFRADGSLKYATYIGGSDEESPESNQGLTSVATHPFGWAAIAGWTKSADFPVTPGAFQETPGGNWDAYVVKFGCTLDPPVQVSAQGPTEFCAGDSVRLTARGVYAWYRWSNGERTSSIVVRNSGSYTLMVADSNDCGGVSAPVVVTVHPLPQPSITANGPTTLCEGDSVGLEAGAGFASYQWSNGATSRMITVGSSGTFTVIVSDINGCSNVSPPVTVVVNPRPTATIAVNGPAVFCAGDSTMLDAGAGFASYLWSNGATSRMIVVRQSGTFTVKVTNTFGCESTSQPVALTVHPLPQAVITPDGPTTICDGDSVRLDAGAGFSSYLWSNGATSRSIVVKTTSSHSVTITDVNGCRNTSPVIQVVVNPKPNPVITSLGSTTFCAGDSVLLDAGAGFDTYLWSNGATTRRIAVRASGNYTVTVAFATGCMATSAALPVTVYPNPTPSITPGGPLAFCEGDSVVLFAPPGFVSYRWSNGMSIDRIVVKTAGDYFVTVTDANGCTGTSETRTIVVHPNPAVPTIVQQRDTLVSSLEFAYQWNLNGMPLPGETGRMLLVPRSGTYTVTVFTQDGCSATSLPLSVRIAQTVVSIPVLEAAPGERVTIPLQIASSENLLASGARRYRAVVKLNRNILEPIGAGGVWTDDGTSRTITLQGQWTDTLGTLATFDCRAMLGTVESTPLAIEFFEWAEGAVRVTRVDGEFRLTICREGGPRLFDWTGVARLKQNHPNPFNTRTTIEYEIIEAGQVRIEVYDMLGRRVDILVDHVSTPGSFRYAYDASTLPSGLYLCVMRTETMSLSRLMTVAK